MIRSFIFKSGKLMSQDVPADVLRLFLFEDDVHIWVDVEAPTGDETSAILERTFDFHPLAIEDCVTVSERPKVDEYENYLFLVIHAVDYTEHEFKTTEVNFFLGRNFLVTYHRAPLRSVAMAIDRVQKNSAAVARAPDRLAYTLLDFLFENYQPALDDLAQDVARLEQNMLANQAESFLERVIGLKTEIQNLRQIVGPQREVIKRLAHGEFRIVRAHLLPYYRDLLDRLVRISDVAENYRESLNSMLQLHLNLQQMQVNHVIKVLTVLATLATPLLLITSFYGMNLNHFPPCDATSWHWVRGYMWVFGVSGAVTLGIYLFLRRKKWI